MYSANHHLLHPRAIQSLTAAPQSTVSKTSNIQYPTALKFSHSIELSSADPRYVPPRSLRPVTHAMDEDIGNVSFSLQEDYEGFGGSSGYIISSSEGEDSDIDTFLTPFADTDLPLIRNKFENIDAALTLSAHRLAHIQKSHGKNRRAFGIQTTR